MKCTEVTRLCSEEFDRPLSLGERLRLRAHLAICRACANFRAQMGFLRVASRRLREGRTDSED